MGAHERELQCSMFAAFLPGMSAFDRSLAFDLNAEPTLTGAYERG